MLIWTKRLLLSLGFVSLVTTNVLTLTSVAFNAALSSLVGTALGVQTVSGLLASRAERQQKVIARHKAVATSRKAAARRFGARLTARTKRVAAKSLAAIPAESIPMIGIGVLIADTGYELYAACETLNDLDRLYADLEMEDETPDEVLRSVCNPELPDTARVWDEVVEKSSEWLDRLVEAS